MDRDSHDREDGDDLEQGVQAGGDAAPLTLTDLHSHLVPAVDDGARTLEDTLDGVDRMVERGIRRIVTTPHFPGSLTLRPDQFEAALQTMDEGFEQARRAVLGRFPQVDFLRGHEVKLDVPDPDLSDPRLRLAGSAVVLVEWPGLQFPPGTPRVLREMVDGGVRPLIAHPERYRAHDQSMSAPGAWRDSGAWLQVNYGSLAGRYGPQPRARAFALLERGWVDCFSTDFHGREHLRLYVREVEDLFGKMEQHETWRLLTSVNPERIQRGETPMAVPPVQFPKGVVERIRTLLGGMG